MIKLSWLDTYKVTENIVTSKRYILKKGPKSHFMTAFHNFAFEEETDRAKRLVSSILETRIWCIYLHDLLFFTWSVYLEPEKFVDFNCVQLIIKLSEGLEILLSSLWGLPLLMWITFLGERKVCCSILKQDYLYIYIYIYIYI